MPGLIHAYKTVTAAALDQAVVVEKWIEELVELEFDYPVMGEVMYLLRQAEANIYHQELQLFCVVKAGIPRVHSKQYLERLSELRGVKISFMENT